MKPDAPKEIENLKSILPKIDELKKAFAVLGSPRDGMAFMIVTTFCLCVLLFVIIGGIMSLCSDESHMKQFLSFVNTIGTLMSSSLGFVLGYYFANSGKKE